jgi:enoyl-[acyl-carrier protein] reductase I
MTQTQITPRWLEGKKGLVVGIANDKSIAWGCARAFAAMGADLAVTYLNDKAKPYVEPLAQQLNAGLFLPCDVQSDAALDSLFETIQTHWGKLDFVLHSIAFAPVADLKGRLVDSSRDGFLTAMDISCHSFIRMARKAEPLMKDGGTLITMSYYGAEKVIRDYDLMGPVKAALEASVRYLAYELGPQKIRVHAVSPGPLATRAASGLKDINALVHDSAERAPLHTPLDLDDIGWTTAYLATDKARALTGETLHIDGGYHIMG